MPGSPGLAARDNCGSGSFTLTATPGDTQVSLSWCEPIGDPDSPYYGYYIYEGTSSGGETTRVNSSPLGIAVTSYDVPNLTDGTPYYFVVQAVSKLGSYPSTEASATPEGRTSAPGAPTGLTATPGSSQVSLSWNAPTSDGGSPVTSYNVYEGNSPGGESETPVASVTGTSTVVARLTNGTPYYFVVTAVNAAGEGPSSTEVPATPAGQGSGGSNGQGSGGTSGQGSGGSNGQGSGGQPSTNLPAAPTGSVSLPILLLGATILSAGAVALAVRRLRARSQTPTGTSQSVHVERDAGAPAQTAVHSTGPRATVTVRIERYDGASSTMTEEIQR